MNNVISFHRYQLSETPLRQGALFQVIWKDGSTGYADFFPWPEFGDLSLDEQLNDLKNGKTSNLLQRTLYFAKRDAEARARKKSLFFPEIKIKNHYLINDFTRFSDLEISSAFDTVKIKCGRDFMEEQKFVRRFIQRNQDMRIRLDFNAKANFNDFKKFLLALSKSERAHIEFIEDPLPMDTETWTEARKFIPLAVDFEFKFEQEWEHEPCFDVLVLKPARTNMDSVFSLVKKWGLKVCVTNSMDHPVGAAHALALVQRAIHDEVHSETQGDLGSQFLECGCLIPKFYNENDFSREMIVEGPYFRGVSGFGIGFDDLFRKIEWSPQIN